MFLFYQTGRTETLQSISAIFFQKNGLVIPEAKSKKTEPEEIAKEPRILSEEVTIIKDAAKVSKYLLFFQFSPNCLRIFS